MKKKALLFVASFMVAGFMGSSSAIADSVVPGTVIGVDQSVMGVGKTIMEMGSADRAYSRSLIAKSGALLANQGGLSGVNTYFQFGSSQTDQSWKAQRTVEEASVRGLVPGDCQGDNSDDAYRNAMNQSRDGFMKETLVPNSMCADNHPTLK
ncbi:MAG: hypothetical protein G3M70_15145 [Candidatus Nitronauta litoralis]|uniref:Uncharacterized protein n=1 Tax=Candidatus Nitronauta litoralis TaxID=2705533 RepID=A0A7T0BY70_9BACT|nr:MAG: hypothetical protein G3M70_15145 [Candidatus Nitronauta litoralis]